MCIYTDYYRRENCMNNYMHALLAKLYFIRLLNDNNVINYILIFFTGRNFNTIMCFGSFLLLIFYS